MKHLLNLNSKTSKALMLALILLFLLAACGPKDETTPSPGESSYPSPGESSYPSPGESSYPVVEALDYDPAYPPEPAEINEAERFHIDRPIAGGDTTISGTAPKNITVAVVDITFGGIILGTGVTDDTGRFSIPVQPLPGGHRIGLTITDITDGRTFEEVAVELYDYRGEGFINIPSVGVFFDSEMTRE